MAKQKYIVTFEYRPQPTQGLVSHLGYIGNNNPTYKILESLQEVEDFLNDNEVKTVRIYEIASEYRLANQKVKLEKRA